MAKVNAKAKALDRVDPVLLIDVLVLTLLGLIMVYSASSVVSYEDYGDSAYFFKKQLVWAFLGIIAAGFFMVYEPEKMKKFIPFLLFVFVIMLFMVHVPGFGKKAGGAVRWLKLPGLPQIQPFEFVKLFYAMYLAFLFSDVKTPFKKIFIKSIVVTAAVCFGLILQRDLGGTFIIMALFIIMTLISGAPLKIFAVTIPAAVFVVVAMIVVEPYRVKRMFVYLDPWKDYFGAGWQTAQSLIAIGTGGIFGMGLSQGQQKFLYLPTPHTDYIYSIVGEETGFIGAALVAVMFFIFLWRGSAIAINAKDRFLKLLACAVTFMIGVQAFTNMGVATGILPPKGTTLPFFSAGGSSLLVSLMAAGILLGVSRKVFGEGK
ncbi:MAG: putative lipid II flippase FtsW [Candidatus Goldiibacteriota bacterium HGW-Goldbacteria-1]|jgi:cell division protein FtsW|nr:MAG: putative lipid II flippase FtsW [Candidatus Goldiibacteriota bacterium HGW-Goldbacteria-1]